MDYLRVLAANVTTPTQNYSRVRIVAANGVVNIFDRANGAVLASEPFSVVTPIKANRTWSVELADGTSWAVTKAGCGCGGR